MACARGPRPPGQGLLAQATGLDAWPRLFNSGFLAQAFLAQALWLRPSSTESLRSSGFGLGSLAQAPRQIDRLLDEQAVTWMRGQVYGQISPAFYIGHRPFGAAALRIIAVQCAG